MALERYNRAFPREALKEAVCQREEITPELLRILEYALANAQAIGQQEEDGSYFAYMYAMYLLAQFRETRAYPLVAQFAALPEGILRRLVSDFITEGLDCVLASVCGGETNLIEALIENPKVEEYVRGAAIYSLLILVAAGDKTRDEIMAYFKTLFDGRLERSFSEAWNALVSCATNLYPDEVYDQIVAAYEEGLVEPFAIRIEEVEKVMALDRHTALERLPMGAPVYIQDVIEEMAWWACFNQQEPSRKSKRTAWRKPKRQDAEGLFLKAIHPNPPEFLWPFATQQKTKPVPQPPGPAATQPPSRADKIKPNDPCPCGSGKKFKKCCGRLA